ncbi:MAG: transcription antitermination factor NusB [Arenicellales bacterium]|nr:transcription antitermination factor NusB [Arenicellales bacterium]MDP6551556.1 transcription antitermination factor NusB [Arenicellales bacterium]MDP6790930.1 transcription antitermination factor NusB [Arenicellales bacterium]MDP6918477.1 transcription antitermination factor NusB [Arenicellales bacterium]
MASVSRHLARRCAAQALYQWMITGQPTAEIESGFISDDALTDSDIGYFRHLIGAVPERRDALEQQLHALIERPLSQLDPVERAIILIGAYEILFRHDIPDSVAINEAVEMAHLFGAKDSYKFVNGVLDRLAGERGVTDSKAP